jgi:hypothetical protein
LAGFGVAVAWRGAAADRGAAASGFAAAVCVAAAGLAAARLAAPAAGLPAPGLAAAVCVAAAGLAAAVCVAAAGLAAAGFAPAAAGPTVGAWPARARATAVGETLDFGGTRVAVGAFGASVGFGAGIGLSDGTAVGSGVAFSRFWMVWASGGPATTPVVAVTPVITTLMTAIPIGPRTKEPSMNLDSHHDHRHLPPIPQGTPRPKRRRWRPLCHSEHWRCTIPT